MVLPKKNQSRLGAPNPNALKEKPFWWGKIWHRLFWWGKIWHRFKFITTAFQCWFVSDLQYFMSLISISSKQSSNVVSIIVAAPLLPRMGRWELCGGGKWLWQTLTNADYRLCWSSCSMWFFDTKKIQKASILWFIMKLVLSYWSSEVPGISWFPISRWSCLSRGHPSRESAQWCVTSTMSRAPQTYQPGSTGIRDQR